MPGLWRLRVRDWRRFNRIHRSAVNGKTAPSPNDEYLLYQTLVGAWPLEPLEEDNDWRVFRERIENYMLKAIREAKQNTSWINQNTEYETAVSSFVKAVLNPDEQNRFMSDFVPFQRRVARIGLWNSLSQAVLKLTCPGVPDIYQGNDLWDFSLVDPDNRRPVDYPRRQKAFDSIRRMSNTPDTASAAELLQTADDGRLKLYIVWKTLCLRKEYPELFQLGEYIPLEIQGAHADRAVAFMRRFEKTSVLVVVPRLVAALLNETDLPPIGPAVWTDTCVVLPRCGCSVAYQNMFTGELLASHQIDDKAVIDMSNALAHFPVAFCLQGSRHL
jgi:(1->4)-alpha-D-glucan 1-alpha-D-glucosylmutase